VVTISDSLIAKAFRETHRARYLVDGRAHVTRTEHVATATAAKGHRLELACGGGGGGGVHADNASHRLARTTTPMPEAIIQSITPASSHAHHAICADGQFAPLHAGCVRGKQTDGACGAVAESD